MPRRRKTPKEAEILQQQQQQPSSEASLSQAYVPSSPTDVGHSGGPPLPQQPRERGAGRGDVQGVQQQGFPTGPGGSSSERCAGRPRGKGQAREPAPSPFPLMPAASAAPRPDLPQVVLQQFNPLFPPEQAFSTPFPPTPPLQAYPVPFQQMPYQPGPLVVPLPSGAPADMTPPVIPTPGRSIIQQFGALELGGPSQVVQEVTPAPTSTKSIRFPLRPSIGKAGTKILVKANHFFAELPDKDLHQYDVTITPEVSSRGVNRAVMRQLVKQHRTSALGHRLPAYDGRKSLYTAGPLPFQSRDFVIALVDEDDGSGTQRKW